MSGVQHQHQHHHHHHHQLQQKQQQEEEQKNPKKCCSWFSALGRMGDFQRPVGAPVDVKELEFISSLLQADIKGSGGGRRRQLRTDGSITAMDIVHFLSSRYGIVVTKEQVTQDILAGLGGGDGEEECIDITEMVTILLIPFLLKAKKSASTIPISSAGNGDCFFAQEEITYEVFPNMEDIVMPVETPNIIGEVAYMILSDLKKLTTTTSFTTATSDNDSLTQQQQPMNTQFIKQILLYYGEDEMAQDDDLLQQMVAAAGGAGSHFCAESFAMALTSDILNYPIENETKITTNYFDVYQTHYSTAEQGFSTITKASSKFPFLKSQKIHLQNSNNNDQHHPTITNYHEEDAEMPSSQQQQQHSSILRPVTKNYTAPQMDASIDDYKSKFFTVLLWAFFLMFNFAYLPNPTSEMKWIHDYCPKQTKEIHVDFVVDTTYVQTTTSFACKVGTQVVSWCIIAIVLCCFGTFFMSVGSIGNSIYSHDKRAVIASSICMLLITVVPFYVTSNEELMEYNNNNNNEEVQDPTKELATAVFQEASSSMFNYSFRVEANTEEEYEGYHISKFRRWPAFLLGILVVIMQCMQLVALQFPDTFQELSEKYEGINAFFTHGNIISETNIKKAAAYKINQMVKHARQVHGSLFQEPLSPSSSSSSRRRQQQQEGTTTTTTTNNNNNNNNNVEMAISPSPSSDSGDSSSMAVDMIKEKKTFLDKALLTFEKSNDLSSYQSCGGFLWTWKKMYSGDLYKKEGIWLSSRMVVGNLSQLIIAFVVLFYGITQTNYQVWIEEHATSDKNAAYVNCLRTAGLVGSAFGFVATIYIVSMCIPSSVSTSLKFRCGLLPSLHDNYGQFIRYRSAPDTASSLLGSMLWGSFFTGIGIFVFFATVTFLAIFPVTKEWFTGLLASFIGFLITLIIRVLVLLCSRRAVYVGLYRTNPARANLMVLALECWNVGLGFGFMLARIVKLLLVALFYVGRVDTPIVAPGVGQLGPIELDNISTIFRRDIVSHEAHRHPYIETLGVMYMMKLRHGASFATRAGSCWRLIFVFALMPWLRSYRVLTKYGVLETDGDEHNDSEEDALAAPIHRVDDKSSMNIRLMAENARLKKELEMISKRNLGLQAATVY